MLKTVLYRLTGSVRISSPDARRVTNLFLHRRFFSGKVRMENGRIVFDLPLILLKKTLFLFEKHRIPYTIEKKEGLPFFLWNYRYRFGLWLGLLCYALLLVLSSEVLWSVKVVGLQSESDAKILERLDEMGVGVGKWKRSIDPIAVSNQYVIENGDLSYMAINLCGNCAEVVVRSAKGIEKEPDERPSSIVAQYDGLIERIELYSGKILVDSGGVVQKGQVVVSGLLEDEKDGTYQLVRAKAHVFARITRDFSVCVELEETVPSEPEIPNKSADKALLFFGKRINIFKNSCLLDVQYDIIRVDRYATIGKDLVLPVGISETFAGKKSEKTVRYSTAEAAALAGKRLADEISRAGIEVLSIEKTSAEEDGRYILNCTVYGIADIACEIPMTKN